MHLLQLAEKVKDGLTAAGLVGMRFNTIGVSDGISMGTDGMTYSLQSRDLIADSIETVMAAQWYDANLSRGEMMDHTNDNEIRVIAQIAGLQADD